MKDKLKLILSKIQRLPINQLIALLSLISMLLAVQLHYIQLGAINNDFVLYHEASRLIMLGEWKSAFSLFGWPLYSVVIASLSALTGLGLQSSAQVISVIFFGLTTASFLKIIHMAGGDYKAIMSGALILFSSQYIVGDVLPMLVRDHGFWAFFLLSLVFFIRYYQSEQIKDALCWQLSIIIATLFRIEGITYLIFLPMLLLINNQLSWRHRLNLIFKAQSVNLAIALMVGLAVALLENLKIEHFGRLKEIFSLNLYQEITNKFIERAAIMADSVLGNHLDTFAYEGLLLVFVFIIATKIISTSGWVGIGLAIMTFRKKWAGLNPYARQVLMSSMSIALVNMFLIITKVFVLSGRYVAAFSFLIMILAAFYMAHILRHINTDAKGIHYKKWLAIALLVIMSLSLVKNMLPKPNGSNFEQKAISWIKNNNPDNLSVFYDNARLRFYAGELYIGRWIDSWLYAKNAIDNKKIFQFEFLVISVNADGKNIEPYIQLHLPEYQEVHRSYGVKKKKFVVVYKKN